MLNCFKYQYLNAPFIALNLPSGKRTTMHLVPREKLPPLAADGKILHLSVYLCI